MTIKSNPSVLAALFGPAMAPAVQGQELLMVGASTVGLYGYLAPGKVLLIEPDHRRIRSARREWDDCSGRTTPGCWQMEQGKLANWRLAQRDADAVIARHRVIDSESLQQLEEALEHEGQAKPFIAPASRQLLLLDLLPNRLDPAMWASALQESFRVLAIGGSVLVAALVADEAMADRVLPERSIFDEELSFPTEQALLASVAAAGFYGLRFDYLSEQPVDRIAGVDMRAAVLRAYKGKQGVCLDQGHAVMYPGPWSAVEDDDGHRYLRGARTAVCAKTYGLLMRAPYKGDFVSLNPPTLLPLDQALQFDCNTPTLRDIAVTRGERAANGGLPSTACGPDGCC
ncbi:MAG: hypothetical protein V4631_18175 [Pseudomonadota bacterium]